MQSQDIKTQIEQELIDEHIDNLQSQKDKAHININKKSHNFAQTNAKTSDSTLSMIDAKNLNVSKLDLFEDNTKIVNEKHTSSSHNEHNLLSLSKNKINANNNTDKIKSLNNNHITDISKQAMPQTQIELTQTFSDRMSGNDNIANIQISNANQQKQNTKNTQKQTTNAFVKNDINTDVKDINSNNQISMDRFLLLNKYVQQHQEQYFGANKDMVAAFKDELYANKEKTITTNSDVVDASYLLSNDFSQTKGVQNANGALLKEQTQFMSNIAKQIYANYKPPLSSLKISLHPAMLGSLDVVIKNTKQGINVNITASNSIVAEMFEQNKASLQLALAQIAKDSEVSLSFNSNENQANSNQESSQDTKYAKTTTSINNNTQIHTNEEVIEEALLTSGNLAYM